MNSKKETKKRPNLMLILFCVVLISLWMASLKIKFNWPDVVGVITLVFLFGSVFALLVIFLVGETKTYKEIKQYWKFQEDAIKTKFSSENQEVKLSFSSRLQEDDFKCLARKDENGKIIVKVHYDKEFTFENEENFLDCFHFKTDDE